VLAATTSTNTVALGRSADLRNDGLSIFADYQAEGRGRFARRWVAPEGSSVLCSVLIFLPEGFSDFGIIGLASGVAVCRAIETVGVSNPCLKWPNDVLIQQRKVAGILVELGKSIEKGRTPCVVGVGVNCHQKPADFDSELQDHAGSLDGVSGAEVSRLDVAAALLEALDAWLADDRLADRAAVAERWAGYGQRVGERITLKSGGRVYHGVIVAMDPTVGITVELDEGGRRLFEAPVTHRV